MQEVGIDMCHITQLLRLIFEQVNRFFVQLMLYDIGTHLVIGIESMEMLQSLGPAAKIVVNFETASILRKLLKFAQEWEVFSRVLHEIRDLFASNTGQSYPLSLLSNQQCELEVVETQSMVVQTVSICEETHMLNCVLCLLRALFC